MPINTVRDLLPQLNTGKVVRGRIGVQIAAVPREGFEDFGLKTRTGAIVKSAVPGGAAEKGGIEAGDVIVEFDGHAVPNMNELQRVVAATKPGTTASVKVLRDKKERTLRITVEELDLATEQQGLQGRAPQQDTPGAQSQDKFGLSLGNLTPADARRLRLPARVLGAVVAEVDPNGPSIGQLQEDDVILSVNDQVVSNAAEAGRELQRIASGRYARILVWRGNARVFVTVKKD